MVTSSGLPSAITLRSVSTDHTVAGLALMKVSARSSRSTFTRPRLVRALPCGDPVVHDAPDGSAEADLIRWVGVVDRCQSRAEDHPVDGAGRPLDVKVGTEITELDAVRDVRRGQADGH